MQATAIGNQAALASLSAQLQSLRRVALAVAHPGGPTLFSHLVHELAVELGVAVAFVAGFADDAHRVLRTLAARMDGAPLQNFDYPIAGTPCALVVGREFRYVARGVAAEFPPQTMFGAAGMDSYAAFPLNDSAGHALGLVVALDRAPIAGGDAEHAEAMLKIFAVRAAAEIERLSASEALQKSEASYRAIFETAEDAIFIHDWDTGAILDVNPKACQTYGYSHDEMTRLSVADVSSGVPPFTGEAAARWIELAKADRCPPFEWHRRNKDGSLHWDEVRLKPVTINGRAHILGFSREVTERKAALAALESREAQYRAIFDGSADAMVLWNSDLRIVDVNAAFTRFYGYRHDEVVGESFGHRIGAEGVARRVERIRAALAGEECMMETQAVRKDGSRFDVELRYLPIVHAGSPHVLAVGRDITERVERERALQRSEARLRATVEAAFDCVIGMDGDGRIVEFNAAAERVFGYRRQDVLGQPLAEAIIPERRRDAHARWLRDFPVTGSGPMLGRLVETTVLTAAGQEIPVELAVSVAKAPDGNIFVGHLRDITARRNAEVARGALEAQLRQAQKMEAIGQLTGGIAHDFNNILTSVIGYVVLGEERAEAIGDAALMRQLGQAHLAAQRARDLIAQMLAFARRQRGERRVLDMAPLVQQTLRLLRATLPSSITLDGNAGALDAGGDDQALAPCVVADPVQLEQVLFNLCINARDALEGAGRITVRLRTHERAGWQCASCRAPVQGGPWVELNVADGGCGIAPELLERIFDPFFSTKAPGSGSGMGLAMVHGIVHDHGGHLRVQTRPGGGSEFAVLLPRVAATADAPAAPAPRKPSAPALRGRVLVVEDDPMVGDFLVERLASWGLDALLQREPLGAVAWLEDPAHHAALLITDQTMPQMTGLQLAVRARRLRPALPVLLVSGNAAGFDADELARCGVHAALGKPIDAERLRALMAEALAGARPA